MERTDIPRLIIVSVVGIVLYQTLFMETVKYTSAKCLFTHFYFTYFTTAFAIFLKQEKFSSRKLIGSMTAFVGAALVLVAGHSLTSSFMAMELTYYINMLGALSCFSRTIN